MNEKNKVKKEWTQPSLILLDFKNTKSGVNEQTAETTFNDVGDQS